MHSSLRVEQLRVNSNPEILSLTGSTLWGAELFPHGPHPANLTHMTTNAPRWLNKEESATWRAVWTLMTWLPARLETQMSTNSGMSLVEYQALSQISMAPRRTMRLSDLGAVTNMRLSHLSRVITRLENEGYVRRYPDPTDGRYTLATLTESGWERVQEAAPGHVEAVRRYLFDDLTEDEARALGRAAAKVAMALEPPGQVRTRGGRA